METPQITITIQKQTPTHTHFQIHNTHRQHNLHNGTNTYTANNGIKLINSDQPEY